MNALLILDKDSKTDLSEDLRIKLVNIIKEMGNKVDVFELGKNDVFQCLGCLLCLTKHPGECVHKDVVQKIRQQVKKYSVTFYLTPILFGHYSSTIAAAINKGTGSHEWQVIIGFGEDVNDEEKNTFIDLIAKHRGKADIVHPDMDKQVDVFVSKSIEDNSAVIDAIKRKVE
ncbi:MAG TPA: NAD(P)H-dependent oxidoreductase [Candidatus Sulfotelmatobacter sp.]|nr:NAD(P)H-dependent oxidoreductase [Candidatus Sulfotelmatobacter sp.]